jgi:hypothetical protein
MYRAIDHGVWYDCKWGAKVQQIFGISKDLTIKIKFIYIFSEKDLIFAQVCDCTFEGVPFGGGGRRYNKYLIYARV